MTKELAEKVRQSLFSQIQIMINNCRNNTYAYPELAGQNIYYWSISGYLWSLEDHGDITEQQRISLISEIMKIRDKVCFNKKYSQKKFTALVEEIIK